MTLVKVSQEKFRKIADECWGKYMIEVQKLTPEEKTKERCKELQREHVWAYLEGYEIALTEKPVHVNPDAVALIERYCWDFYDKDADRRVYTGSGVAGIVCEPFNRPRIELNESGEWEFMDEWCNGYREVWISRKDRLILTICEGDISIVLCKTEESFQEDFKDKTTYYQ